MSLIHEGLTAIRDATNTAYQKNKVDQNGGYKYSGPSMSPTFFGGATIFDGYKRVVQQERDLGHTGFEAHRAAMDNLIGGAGIAMKADVYAIKEAAKGQVGFATIAWAIAAMAIKDGGDYNGTSHAEQNNLDYWAGARNEAYGNDASNDGNSGNSS